MNWLMISRMTPAEIIRVWVSHIEVMLALTLKRALANRPEIPQKVQATMIMTVPKTFLFVITFHFPI